MRAQIQTKVHKIIAKSFSMYVRAIKEDKKVSIALFWGGGSN